MSAERPDWDRVVQQQEVQYQRLIDYLLEHGLDAERLSPERIGVRLMTEDGEHNIVEILMTPDEWESLTSTIFGEFDLPAGQLHDALRTLPAGYRYLVWEQYELIPQTTPMLPEITIRRRKSVAQWRA